MAGWVESPAETRAEERRLLDEEIAELELALIDGLRADSAEATERALARLVAYREKEYGERERRIGGVGSG